MAEALIDEILNKSCLRKLKSSGGGGSNLLVIVLSMFHQVRLSFLNGFLAYNFSYPMKPQAGSELPVTPK